MNKKKLCLHLLLSSLVSATYCPHAYTLNLPFKLSPITAALTASNVATATMAFLKNKESYEARRALEDLTESYEQQTIQLEEHKKQCIVLQNIINDFKNEIAQKKQDQEFLSSIDLAIDRIQHTYATLLEYSTQNHVDRDDAIRTFLDTIDHLCTTQNISARTLRNTILTELEILVKYRSGLQIAQTEWSAHNKRAHLLEHVQEKKEILEVYIKQLRTIADLLAEQEQFISLSQVLTEIVHARQPELELAQKYDDQEQFIKSVKERIRAYMSDDNVQFPHLIYVKTLNKDVEKLRKALLGVESLEYQSFQIEFIEQAHNMYSLLDYIQISLVNSKAYKKEKEYKPVFEQAQQDHLFKLREQELLTQAKLQDQQARIEKEKRDDELRIQKEINKAHQLEQNQRLFEQEQKKLELKEAEITLEIARIRDGENVKHALAENNSTWQKQVDKLEHTFASLEQQYNQLKAECSQLQSILEAKKQENNILSTEIKNIQKANTQLNTDIDDIIAKHNRTINTLEKKLSTLYTGIEAIESNFDTISLDDVNQIQEFIDTLHAQVMSLKGIIG